MSSGRFSPAYCEPVQPLESEKAPHALGAPDDPPLPVAGVPPTEVVDPDPEVAPAVLVAPLPLAEAPLEPLAPAAPPAKTGPPPVPLPVPPIVLPSGELEHAATTDESKPKTIHRALMIRPPRQPSIELAARVSPDRN